MYEYKFKADSLKKKLSVLTTKS